MVKLTQDSVVLWKRVISPSFGHIAASGWALPGQVKVDACKSTTTCPQKPPWKQLCVNARCPDHLEGACVPGTQSFWVREWPFMPAPRGHLTAVWKEPQNWAWFQAGENGYTAGLWALLFIKPLEMLTSLDDSPTRDTSASGAGQWDGQWSWTGQLSDNGLWIPHFVKTQVVRVSPIGGPPPGYFPSKNTKPTGCLTSSSSFCCTACGS